MPAVPKKKSTKARTGKRRGANRMGLPNLSLCPSCKKPKLSHIVCPHCGFHHRASK